MCATIWNFFFMDNTAFPMQMWFQERRKDEIKPTDKEKNLIKTNEEFPLECLQIQITLDVDSWHLQPSLPSSQSLWTSLSSSWSTLSKHKDWAERYF